MHSARISPRTAISALPWRYTAMASKWSTCGRLPQRHHQNAVAARHHGQHVLHDEGVASLAVTLPASRGLIDYDAKVADYWPQFAQAGKAEVTVRQLLSHQAGLSALDAPLDWPTSATRTPCRRHWRPKPRVAAGSRHGYHALTLGWYESELIRHTDPAGRTLGQFFADEIAAPLGLDLYIGLPASVNRDLSLTCTAGRGPRRCCT